jgi:excinuclease ABC subunit C
LQQIRDEAHRFAVTYHRVKRGKRMTRSVLDAIPGLGPVRRKKLMRVFGSVKRMREASIEDIAAIRGLPRPVAEAVFGALHGGEAYADAPARDSGSDNDGRQES